MKTRIVRVTSTVVAMTLSLAAGSAVAQQKYPVKPIRLVSPFAPGGGTDILARLLAQPISEALGQTIVVDNRPGGGGSVGAATVVRAEPDGYTLILVSGSYGANAALHNLPYDSVTDITPIILIGTTGLVSSWFPKSPITSIKDVITFAKANPGKLLFGSAGVGGLGHMAQELFRLQTGVTITHVPYKGTGPVMTALLTGEVHSSFSSSVASMPHIKAGRLRPIAVTPSRRMAALPEVPTISETVPGYEVVLWYGIWGPKGMPKDVALRLNAEFAKVIRTDAMKTWFAGEGMEIAAGPPGQFLERIRSDVEKWKKVVKEANIKVAG